MVNKSTQIALGGVFSALCVLVMFMSGMIPFSTFSLPALAGAMLIVVVIENGTRVAVMVYVSVSLLSVFIVPEKEAAMLFVAFFGYYVIVKGKLERIRFRLVRYLAKFLLFNVSVFFGYALGIWLLGIPSPLNDMGDFGRYSVAGIFLLANLMFVCYDYALGKYIVVYVRWFKPRFLGKK